MRWQSCNEVKTLSSFYIQNKILLLENIIMTQIGNSLPLGNSDQSAIVSSQNKVLKYFYFFFFSECEVLSSLRSWKCQNIM